MIEIYRVDNLLHTCNILSTHWLVHFPILYLHNQSVSFLAVHLERQRVKHLTLCLKNFEI